MAALGGLDIVVNNAGIMNDRLWELEVDVNLVSKDVKTGKSESLKFISMTECSHFYLGRTV